MKLPYLLVVYDVGSATAFDIGRAARNLCRPVFVVDTQVPSTVTAIKMMSRVGAVCDIAGLGFAKTVRKLAAYEPSGVITFSDSRLVLAAELCMALGVPGLSPEAARRVVNKRCQRQSLRAGGLPTPQVRFIKSVDDLIAAAADATGQLVVKPVHGAASVDTFLVERHVPGHVSDPVRRRTALGEFFIAEDFLQGDPDVAGPSYGDYVSVESLASRAGAVHFAITGKFPLTAPFRETGMLFPCTLDEATQSAVINCADAALRALNIDSGTCHTEIKLTAEGPRIIEVNARLGGYVSTVIEQAGAPSLLAAAMRHAIDIEHSEPIASSPRVGFQLFMSPPPGARMVGAVHGLDAASSLSGVDRISVLRRPGESVNWLSGTEGLVALITGYSADHAQLRGLRAALAQTLVIDYR